MISFVEYVCERLMGPPAYGSMWYCPFHEDNSPSFSVRPTKQRPNGTWYPIKFRCFACDAWGDAWDLLRRFYPKESYPQHLQRYKKLQREYEELTGVSINSPGIRGQSGKVADTEQQERLQFCFSEFQAVMRERRLKWSSDVAGLKVLVWADHITRANGVSRAGFIRYCATKLIERKESGRARRKPK